MELNAFLAAHVPQVARAACEAVLALAADGATVPFIARYRKERTGNLDEVQIQAVLDAKEAYDGILARQAFVLEEIERQNKLTPELRERILASFDRDTLEDLYLPYKRKRRSRAGAARDAGLEPLADWIWNTGHGTETPQPGQTLELWAFTFRNEEKGYADAQAAIDGAADILVERMSESRELRERVREAVREKGFVVTERGPKARPNSKFEKYFDRREAVSSLMKPVHSHRTLAIRRGVAEEELAASIAGGADDPEFEERLVREFQAAACTVPDAPGAEVLQRVARVALRDHVLPSIANETHKALRQVADDVAIRVFGENVRKLLLGAPLGPKAVLGIDPGIRTGCKLAVVDDGGAYKASGVVKLKSDEQKVAAKTALASLVAEHGVRAVAVGNGTAGRETEAFAREALRESGSDVPVVMVSEAGASIYSASEVARDEFPDLDLTIRGAVSIARRLQDPLAELVKIEPQHIGVGQYQHDVAPHLLRKNLEQVVEWCVNQVGVDLNTASRHLLAHVAGIGPSLAGAIVERRAKQGLFRSRLELFDVPHFGRKAFEQAAGFLRVRGGEQALDATGVHPERYEALERFASAAGKQVSDLLGPGVELVKQSRELREALGAFTFADVVADLEKPGRDPRDSFVPFHFREDVHELKDLQPGMVCPGIVTNVTSFGAFVDVGVHQDGLVHVSQLSTAFVRDPREVVSPGDRVQVRVLEASVEKGQISLSMKLDPRADGAGARGGERRGARGGRPGEGARDGGDGRPRERREHGPRRGDGSRTEPRAAGAAGEAAGRSDRGRGERERRRPDERRDGPRDERHEGPRAGAASGGPPRGGQGRRSAEPFNNPFAKLAAMRDSFKPKP